MMFLDWFTVGGLIAVLGVVITLAYMCMTEGCGR
jgi:hypothetical protein